MALHRTLGILRARRRRVAAAALVGLALAAAVHALVPVRYTAVAQVLLPDVRGAGAEALGSSAGRADAQIATQVDILTSQRVALRAVDLLGVAEDPAAIARWRARTHGVGSIRHHYSDRLIDALDPRPSRESSVLGVAFTDTDPQRAAAAANALARAFVDVSGELRDAAGSSGVVLLSAASPPETPSGVSPVAAAAIAALLCLGFGVAGAFAVEARDRRIRGAGDLAHASGLPVLASLRDAFGTRGRRPTADPRIDADAGGPPTVPLDPRTRPMPTAGAPTSADTATGPAPATRRDGPARVAGANAAAAATPAAATPAAAPTQAAANAPADAVALAERPAGADAAPAPIRAQAAPDAAPPPLGQILVQAGLLHPPEVERILAWARHEGMRFGEAAVATRHVTPEQLQRALATQFGYPLLERGASPVSEEVVAAFDARHPFVADLRRLRTRLRGAQLAAPPDAPLKAFALVSAADADGKSFVAANLAVSFAQSGQRTLLVDADLRHGRLHRMFGLANTSGLSSMLNRRIVPGALQRVPGLRDLTLLPSGPQAPNPAELLSRDALAQLLDAFARSFDVMLIDTPAVAEDADAAVVAQRVGAAIVVAREDRSAFDAVAELCRGGTLAPARLVGAVLVRG